MKVPFFIFFVVLMAAGGPGHDTRAYAQPAPEEAPVVDFRQLRDEAQALERAEKWEEARAAYQQLTDKFPDEALSWFLTGRYLTARGLYREAADAFEKGLEIDPESEAAHLYLARLSIELGDPALSSRHSAKVIEIQQQAQRAVPVTPPAEENGS